MPRLRNSAGDETLPICNNCIRSQRYCDHNKEHKFRLSHQHGRHPGEDDEEPVDLSDPNIANLFNHYIKNLANWYDLSDGEASFERQVPLRALAHPLLFNAVIAFAAVHLSKTRYPSQSLIAERCHKTCVKLLIGLKDDDGEAEDGITLAAVCLLRSFEISGEDFDPNRHLSGAFALAMNRSQDLSQISLARAGFFNFMREDITYSLINRCSLKIDTKDLLPFQAKDDEDQLNVATLYLGKAINQTFGTLGFTEANEALFSELQRWMRHLPTQFTPYFETRLDGERATFPTIRMLRNCHVSVSQYCLVALGVLESARAMNDEKQHVLHGYATRLCGLAFTAESPAVLVNSFGPISFLGRFLKGKLLQLDLVRRLQASRKDTGWPVQWIIDDLEQYWAQSNG